MSGVSPAVARILEPQKPNGHHPDFLRPQKCLQLQQYPPDFLVAIFHFVLGVKGPSCNWLIIYFPFPFIFYQRTAVRHMDPCPAAQPTSLWFAIAEVRNQAELPSCRRVRRRFQTTRGGARGVSAW